MHKTVAEYFAGIGLMRMGLMPCGWRVVFANDISTDKHSMYKGFFPDSDYYLVGDVFDIDPTRVPFATLATCSFPCIDLSLAGNMKGLNGEHSSAFWGMVRVLEAQGDCSPPLLLLENVPGWLYSNCGMDFRVVVESLNRLGYACNVFMLDALSFVPQSRRRVFLVGAKLPPTPTAIAGMLSRPPSLMPKRLRMAVIENADLKWFDCFVPPPPPLLSGGLSAVLEPLEESDERWWSPEEVSRHLAMMSDINRARVERLRAEPRDSYRTFFRRRRDGTLRVEVRSDDIAGCLRTAVGGSGKQFLLKAGHGRVGMRAMTVREYARLQGVPDSYPIALGGVKGLTAFGDAVCVPAVTWLAKHVLDPLQASLEAYQ